VADVARQFNYNEDYLSRVFKTFYPDGLKAHIDAVKMQRIKHDLINESISLADISARYSFGDYKYFLKYFKYHEGVSPTKYRQAYYNLHTNNK
jgi:YesN/AraC family two-component response regulator